MKTSIKNTMALVRQNALSVSEWAALLQEFPSLGDR